MEEVFWDNVKAVMLEKKITQKMLAEDLGNSLRTVQSWFTRNSVPNLFVGVRIAKALGCTVEYLVNRENMEELPADEGKLLSLYRDIPDLCKPMLFRTAEDLSSLKNRI